MHTSTACIKKNSHESFKKSEQVRFRNAAVYVDDRLMAYMSVCVLVYKLEILLFGESDTTSSHKHQT